ncbi:MAG: cytochrome c family protein [Alphaproteobacteria bacterium]|nr:cytochrome c family protein [Alphaproteobacteria bacterium]
MPLRAAILFSALLTVAPPAVAGDAAHGQALWEAKCIACHALDANKVGPKHRGVYGREAGTAPGYSYSPALKASHIVWDAASLDMWLKGPRAFVPGTKMTFSLAQPQDRADVIAYLKSLSPAAD